MNADWFACASVAKSLTHPALPMDDRTRQLTYSSDQPIHSKRKDRFNRAVFAQRIADTAASRSDPSSIVIGLYGPWGCGKTSTLNLVEEALDDHSNVVVVRFNPWLYGSEERQLRGFFDTLAAALGRALPRIGDSLAGVKLDELKQQIEEVLEQAGKRVMVLIDDIDRLERAEIQAIFKLVKLSASFTSTSYVLSFDDEMIASSLGERYAQAGHEAGRDYLAKIIQVPLHLPPFGAIELRQVVFDGIAGALWQSRIELAEEEVNAFARHFIEGLEPRLATARHAKLYINSVTFALPLLEEEAHPVDLLLMEGIRVFYPKMYLAIRENAELFLSGGRNSDQNTESTQRRRIADLLRESAPDITPEQRASLRRDLLESLFPRLGKTCYGHDREADWAREQRVCSRQHFQHYFTYSVPPDDIDLDAAYTQALDSSEYCSTQSEQNVHS